MGIVDPCEELALSLSLRYTTGAVWAVRISHVPARPFSLMAAAWASSRSLAGVRLSAVAVRRGHGRDHQGLRRGERHEQHGRDRDAGQPAAQRRRRSIARRIQHREHASFNLSPARHGDDERRRPIAAQRVGQLQQVLGILAGVRAGSQDAIVAGQLPFHAQAPRDPPHAGMDPVDGARRGGHQLREAIVAGDVRQLMEQDGAPPILGPRVGDGRNQDGRPPDAERHRHAALEAPQQPHRTPHAHLRGTLEQELCPFRIADVNGASREPANHPLFVRQPDQEKHHAGDVQTRAAGPARQRRTCSRRTSAATVAAVETAPAAAEDAGVTFDTAIPAGPRSGAATAAFEPATGISTSQRGSDAERIGSTSRPATASVHTRCLDAADWRRRSSALAIAAAARTHETLKAASMRSRLIASLRVRGLSSARWSAAGIRRRTAACPTYRGARPSPSRASR